METRGGKAQLIRWTTDFDCGHETEWWYCIKDCPFNINNIKAKIRYEINKGVRNFDVKVIEPIEYVDDLFDVTIKAYNAYPQKYRPKITFEKFHDDVQKYDIFITYGAFDAESGKLCGYSLIHKYDSFIRFNVQKTIPAYEKKGINAALVYKILCDCNNDLQNGIYIVDGNRNIAHETHFQEYLEKYFEFRKAYCVIHIQYKALLGIFIKCAFPFKKIIKKYNKNKLFHYAYSIIHMEEICRSFKKISK